MSRATAYKWLARYRAHGQPGLADRSSQPCHCPHALPADQVRRVLAARRRHRQGPHRLAWQLRMPRSTIYGVLRRHHMSRLAHLDRTSGAVVRYVRERPGELVHIDVKKLGRIPDGGGHRVRGRVGTRGRAIGYDYVHVAIETCAGSPTPRLPDETGATWPGSWSRRPGSSPSTACHPAGVDRQRQGLHPVAGVPETAAGFGIRHKRTHPSVPRPTARPSASTGPCSRSGPTPAVHTNAERRRAFTRWLRFYNHRRPHTSLDGLTPMAVLVNNVTGTTSRDCPAYRQERQQRPRTDQELPVRRSMLIRSVVHRQRADRCAQADELVVVVRGR